MKPVLIFENEYADLETTFKAINLLHFNNELKITQYNTSQELGDITSIEKYEAIIIDIDLSLKSKKDGYGIIQDIYQYKPELLKKIMVLTGSTKIEDKLNELGFGDVKMSLKPADIDEIAKILKKIIKR